MARPREFDNDYVLDALRDVFWQHGYEGTSYADIMAATGLKKGSLYAAFGDKRALYDLAIARYDDGYVSDGVAMLRNEAVSGADRIAALFDSLIDAAETKRGRWGCLLCNAAIDQAPFEKDVEKSVAASMDRIKQAIAAALADTAAHDKVDLVWTTYFGARVVIKSGGSKAVLAALRNQVMALL
ncbi:TetR/AcrR family transcriptional regulator [Fretibacter rubidus]|uniref:TetR/AcrR family transcriptional regulator n=1 Tax=Fretibacter rubidus TaxID=570162 RepID=UPI00352A60C4